MPNNVPCFEGEGIRMLKKCIDKIRNNKLTSIVLAISIIGIIIVYFKMDINKIVFDKEASYNLLTVNTVFTGFMYTMLGNMVEFSSRPNIVSKDKAGYIDKYFSPIYCGLVFFVFSIFIDVFLLFFGLNWKVSLLIFLSRSCSVVGIIYFVISTIMLRKVINQLRKR